MAKLRIQSSVMGQNSLDSSISRSLCCFRDELDDGIKKPETDIFCNNVSAVKTEEDDYYESCHREAGVCLSKAA